MAFSFSKWICRVMLLSYILLLLPPHIQVAMLKFTGYKLLNSISDTGKAFLIILISDILLGYVIWIVILLNRRSLYAYSWGLNSFTQHALVSVIHDILSSVLLASWSLTKQTGGASLCNWALNTNKQYQNLVFRQWRLRWTRGAMAHLSLKSQLCSAPDQHSIYTFLAYNVTCHMCK